MKWIVYFGRNLISISQFISSEYGRLKSDILREYTIHIIAMQSQIEMEIISWTKLEY